MPLFEIAPVGGFPCSTYLTLISMGAEVALRNVTKLLFNVPILSLAAISWLSLIVITGLIFSKFFNCFLKSVPSIDNLTPK